MKKTANFLSYRNKAFILVVILASTFFFFLLLDGKQSKSSIVSASVPALPKYTIIIDAGHGGQDSGAVVGDVLEKDLNLQISKKIVKALSFYNVNVVQTRTDDSLLADANSKNKKRDDLKNRVYFARRFSFPIFVSVHMNKFPEEKYSGLQVFYSQKNSDSEILANCIQENNKLYLDVTNTRQTKKATSSIFILDRLSCPAVLIECGFLSNKNELEQLKDDDYQNKLAIVISSSIIEFINNLGC